MADADKPITRRFTGEVGNQLLVAAATGVTAGILAAILAIWGFVEQLPGPIGLVPPAAVMAFNLEECPFGWKDYEKGRGHFIIGAATKDEMDEMPSSFARDAKLKPLEARLLGKAGGQQEIILEAKNLPPHSHKFGELAHGYTDWKIGDPGKDPDAKYSYVFPIGAIKSFPVSMLTTQDNQPSATPYEYLPPYVALRFCEKK